VAGCTQEFVSKDNLKKHMKRLHEEPDKYKVCASVEIHVLLFMPTLHLKIKCNFYLKGLII